MIKLAESQLLPAEEAYSSPSKSKTQTNNPLKEKENVDTNYQIMKMQIRTEKPFEKIPHYDIKEMVIKPSYNQQSESSKKKKLTITKLISNILMKEKTIN